MSNSFALPFFPVVASESPQLSTSPNAGPSTDVPADLLQTFEYFVAQVAKEFEVTDESKVLFDSLPATSDGELAGYSEETETALTSDQLVQPPESKIHHLDPLLVEASIELPALPATQTPIDKDLFKRPDLNDTGSDSETPSLLAGREHLLVKLRTEYELGLHQSTATTAVENPSETATATDNPKTITSPYSEAFVPLVVSADALQDLSTASPIEHAASPIEPQSKGFNALNEFGRSTEQTVSSSVWSPPIRSTTNPGISEVEVEESEVSPAEAVETPLTEDADVFRLQHPNLFGSESGIASTAAIDHFTEAGADNARDAPIVSGDRIAVETHSQTDLVTGSAHPSQPTGVQVSVDLESAPSPRQQTVTSDEIVQSGIRRPGTTDRATVPNPIEHPTVEKNADAVSFGRDRDDPEIDAVETNDRSTEEAAELLDSFDPVDSKPQRLAVDGVSDGIRQSESRLPESLAAAGSVDPVDRKRTTSRTGEVQADERLPDDELSPGDQEIESVPRHNEKSPTFFESSDRIVWTAQPTNASIQDSGFETSVRSSLEVHMMDPQPSTPLTTPAQDTVNVTESVGALELEEFLVGVPESESIDQAGKVLGDAVRSAVTSEGRSVYLEVHPKELGFLTIHVTQHAESVEAKIVASESVTSEILVSHREQLVESLNELGIESLDVEISHDRRSSEDFPGERQQHSTPFSQGSAFENTPTSSQKNEESDGLNIIA